MCKISDSEVKRVKDYLMENNLYPDEMFIEDDTFNDTQNIIIYISWGDWKHEHWRCDALMEEQGYICTDVRVYEEDGSDTYSAFHVYEKIDNSIKCVFVEE